MSTCAEEDPVLKYSFKLLQDCTSIELFWIFVVASFLIQLGRNWVWVKNSQASREALNTKVGSDDRAALVWWLMAYTLISFVLHIANFLLMVGGNVWFLSAILLGNLIGTYVFMTYQPSDRHKIDTTGQLEGMLKLFNKAALTNNETIEMEELKIKFKNWLGLNESNSVMVVKTSAYKNIKY
ncbi:MAG: hypothetical protein CMO44_14120 [Verrucomicrobiales bacterium]|nr:hypothetical protein [Verrucomicrobiales bacterium]|tara:strand:- start:4996 stop:5541 length:546 start_codon:yes stop_codon:yes gene_type:complete